MMLLERKKFYLSSYVYAWVLQIKLIKKDWQEKGHFYSYPYVCRTSQKMWLKAAVRIWGYLHTILTDEGECEEGTYRKTNESLKT